MKTETIMVIDDDRDLRESIVEILEDNDFMATGCDSAESALQQIRLEVPSLVIVDNMMPGMGGMALMPLLKNDYPSLKIIMITADARTGDREQALRNGALGFVQKPFDNRTLLELIEAEIVRN